MKVKKFLVASAACALLVGVLAIPASAHGGRHGHHTSATYPLCTVEDCTLTYRHAHDGATYCGHSAGDGHTQCATGLVHHSGGRI